MTPPLHKPAVQPSSDSLGVDVPGEAQRTADTGDAGDPAPGGLRSMADVAADFRRELAARWYTAEQVGALLGARPEDAKKLVAGLRRDGKLLGAWMADDHAYYYPTWQFVNGTPTPEMQPILAVLREHGAVRDHGRRTSGWSEVGWFLSPSVRLSDATPADVLAKDPARVLNAARKEYIDDVATREY